MDEANQHPIIKVCLPRSATVRDSSCRCHAMSRVGPQPRKHPPVVQGRSTRRTALQTTWAQARNRAYLTPVRAHFLDDASRSSILSFRKLRNLAALEMRLSLITFAASFSVQAFARPDLARFLQARDADVARALELATKQQEKNHKRSIFDPASQLVSVSGQYAYKAPGTGDMRGPCPGR